MQSLPRLVDLRFYVCSGCFYMGVDQRIHIGCGYHGVEGYAFYRWNSANNNKPVLVEKFFRHTKEKFVKLGAVVF